MFVYLQYQYDKSYDKNPKMYVYIKINMYMSVKYVD